jgi:amino acid permease
MELNRSTFSTVVELIGASLLIIGVGMLSIPVSLIVGGVLLTLLGASLGGGRS